MLKNYKAILQLDLFKKYMFYSLSVVFLMIANGTQAITISQINGTFSNAEGQIPLPLIDFNLVDNVPGSGFGGGLENQVRWGIVVPGTEQSGLGFTGAAPPALAVNVGDVFEIGQLRHFNTPIFVFTGVTSVDLRVGIEFGDPAGVNQIFDFTLDIFETNNGLPPPDSDDFVSITNGFANEVIDINGVSHTLEILGFNVNGTIVNEFRSPEASTNSAILVGRIVESPVPEPSTISLVALGVGSLMFGYRRRLKK